LGGTSAVNVINDDIPAPGAQPRKLLNLVSSAFDGNVVVPEFQRDFVWYRDGVEELLTSILSRYFIGTLLTLDTPAHNPLFPFRVLEGVKELRGSSPAAGPTVTLVLDGQQRLTSIFYALYAPPIGLRGTTHPYRFFVRLEPAIEGDLDEAVTGVSSSWKAGMDRLEREVEAHRALPLPVLARSREFFQWLSSQDVWDEEHKSRIEALHTRLSDFMIPVVSLVSETGADNIVNIFERVNRTGEPLSLFDLVAARMYVKGLTTPTLHTMWKQFKLINPQLTEQISSETMLRLVALLEGLELKKGALLGLDSLGKDGFELRWAQASSCIVEAWERLKIQYGAFSSRLIPYSTILVPLAALLDNLKSNRLQAIAYRRLDAWYWRAVFGQRYDSLVNNKTIQDVQDIGAWCAGGNQPAWMAELDVNEIPLDAESQRSAIYRGVLCLSALRGSRDFCTGQPIALNECDDDHIFAQSAYGDKNPVNGVLNRAFIRKLCNQIKSARPPSEFFADCLERHGNIEEKLIETLETHLIDERAYGCLLANDFSGFVASRRTRVKSEITSKVDVDA
jgi:hypothetical protein